MTRQELIDHIANTYSARPEFPFPRDNESCVFRHGGNRKWFTDNNIDGLLMDRRLAKKARRSGMRWIIATVF